MCVSMCILIISLHHVDWSELLSSLNKNTFHQMHHPAAVDGLDSGTLLGRLVGSWAYSGAFFGPGGETTIKVFKISGDSRKGSTKVYEVYDLFTFSPPASIENSHLFGAEIQV